MSNYRLSQDAVWYPFAYLATVLTAFDAIDIGGTNATTAWIDTRDYEAFYGIIYLSHTNWNSSDSVTTLKFQQASAGTGGVAGTGTKDVTTSGAGLNYNTTTDTLAAADSEAIIEIRAEDMDQNNAFRFLRLYAAATGNTGPDLIGGGVLVYRSAHKRKYKQGAPAAATMVYVTPQLTSDKQL